MTTKAQRESKEFAHAVMTALLPDAALRKQWLTALAESIIHAHHCDESGMKWGVVLYRNGLSLNIGEHEIFMLGRIVINSAYLTIDTDCLSRHDRQELEQHSIVASTERCDSITSVIGLHIPFQSFHVAYPLIATAHLKSIERATRNHEFYFLQLDHSPGVISHLREELARDDIPDHRYVKDNRETPPVLRQLIAITSHTRNVILCGPSGTGKTYWAHEFARVAITDKRRITFVTFHQSFGYEAFVEGLRSYRGDDGQMHYATRDGIFKRICQQASEDPESDYLLIIDEINRANIARVFGELITLIEDDKRLGRENEVEVRLPYSQQLFGVPANLYILGTMNTIDRSQAMLDPVLRRRFTFMEISPDPALLEPFAGVNLAALLDEVNQRITTLLSRDHQLGHSYLMGLHDLSSLYFAWYYRVVPQIQEYCYNDGERLQAILGNTFVKRISMQEAMPTPQPSLQNGVMPGYELVFLDGEFFLAALRELAGTIADEAATGA